MQHFLRASQSSHAVGHTLNATHIDAVTLRREAPVPAHRVINRLGQLTGHHFPTPTANRSAWRARRLWRLTGCSGTQPTR